MKIITISREFGSGGRELGKRLAEELGIHCYDHEIIELIAKEHGFDERYVANISEKCIEAAYPTTIGHRFAMPPVQIMDQGFQVAAAQQQIIENFAKQGDCVIVGRCADYILREREDVFNVFVHAPMAYRADRIVRLYGESERSPEQRLQDKDKKRRVNYKHYTGRDWGVSQNYHLSLDSADIGVDHCADVILYAMGLDPAKLPMPEGEKMEHT